MYLAHAIEVEVVAGIQRLQNLRALPPAISEALPQNCLLGYSVVVDCDVFVGKGEEEHGAVIAHCKTYHLPAHLRVHHIDQFVSRPVALDLERSHFVTQITLKSTLLSVSQPANA